MQKAFKNQAQLLGSVDNNMYNSSYHFSVNNHTAAIHFQCGTLVLIILL